MPRRLLEGWGSKSEEMASETNPLTSASCDILRHSDADKLSPDGTTSCCQAPAENCSEKGPLPPSHPSNGSQHTALVKGTKSALGVGAAAH